MIFTLNFHEFLHTVYKYVLTSVVKISLMFTQYFEYYAIILRGGAFFRGHIIEINCCNSFFIRSKTDCTICGPMPNVMAALPNIGGALCSTPQSLADSHFQSVVQ